ADLKRGLIGLAQNRLPARAVIEDIQAGDVVNALDGLDACYAKTGREALAAGAVAGVTLAAGARSRLDQGGGVVKALHPFCKLGGRHRTFLEVHLAKSRRVGQACHVPVPHVITTSYLTHVPVENHLLARNQYAYPGPLHLSPGRAVGLRLIPM